MKRKTKEKKFRPTCSGYRVFPGGAKCKGCPDCGHRTNKNPFTTGSQMMKDIEELDRKLDEMEEKKKRKKRTTRKRKTRK